MYLPLMFPAFVSFFFVVYSLIYCVLWGETSCHPWLPLVATASGQRHVTPASMDSSSDSEEGEPVSLSTATFSFLLSFSPFLLSISFLPSFFSFKKRVAFFSTRLSVVKRQTDPQKIEGEKKRRRKMKEIEFIETLKKDFFAKVK